MENNEIRSVISNNENEAAMEFRWMSLYKIGGIAALITVVFWLIEIIAVIFMGPPPSTVIDWFTLFKNYGLLGLFDSFLLDVAALALLIPVFLALYAALRRVNESYVTLAAIIAFVGITLSLSTVPTFSMLSLSNQYAAATTDAQRSLLMTTGQAILNIGQEGTGATMGYILPSVAGLIISVVMLQSKTFSKVTAYAGILANAIQLAEPPVAFAPADFYNNIGLGFLLISLSAVFFVLWHILIARRLLQLARLERKTLFQQSQSEKLEVSENRELR